jgi:hypothetical protein
LLGQKGFETGGERFVPGLAHSENLRDRGDDEGGVGDGRQAHVPDAVNEVAGDRGRGSRSETRLADTAGSAQRDETHIVATQQIDDGGDLRFTADECR